MHQEKRILLGRNPQARGFALLIVMVLLALMTTAVATTLEGTVETLRAGGEVKASEMVKAGVEHGLNAAIAQVQASDATTLASEDVSRAYGQIVEIQLGVEAFAGDVPPAEERVSVGVVIPRRTDGAN